MIQRFVAAGSTFPHGYGRAWVCWDRDGCVAYPIPLNLIIGWMRKIYLKAAHGTSPTRWEQERREWFTKGYNKYHSETEELRREEIRRTVQQILTEILVVVSGRAK